MPIQPARSRINYGYINNAVLWYEQHQYQYLEIPWRMEDREPMSEGELPRVGQGFWNLLYQGIDFGPYRYVAAAPTDAGVNVLLWSTHPQPCWRDFLADARKVLLCQHGIEALEDRTSDTSSSLMFRGEVLGQFGSFIYNGIPVSYGCGLAEPMISRLRLQMKGSRFV